MMSGQAPGMAPGAVMTGQVMTLWAASWAVVRAGQFGSSNPVRNTLLKGKSAGPASYDPIYRLGREVELPPLSWQGASAHLP
jgi:hypothetical protein